MRIILRCLFNADTLALLRRDSQMTSLLDLSKPMPVPHLDAESEIFERTLHLTKRSSGGWFHSVPTMCFSKLEEEQCRYFQLESRKTLKVSDADEDANYDYLKKQLRRLPGHRIKLLDKLILSRLRPLRPNEVANFGSSMLEFIISRGAAQTFQHEKLSGFELRPIISRTTQKEFDGHNLLYSENLMPNAESDLTTIKMDEGENYPDRREVCCLSYSFKGRDRYIADFNRTAEAWGPWDLPVWIVSARVKDVFQANKLKGWAFRPVLEVGTDLHSEYIAKWTKLEKLLAINPGNRL